MDDLKVVLATRLREVRAAQGLTQRDVASRAGLSTTFVGAVERAEKAATVETLARLAAALDVNPGDLLDGGTGRKVVRRKCDHPVERIHALLRGQPFERLDVAERILRELLRPVRQEVAHVVAALKRTAEEMIVVRDGNPRGRKAPKGGS